MNRQGKFRLSSAVGFRYCSFLSDPFRTAARCNCHSSQTLGLSFLTAKKDDLREDVRFRLLRLLQENPELSQRDLARALGVSTGGIYYTLRALVDKGLVKVGNFTASPDKRRYAYILTPKGLAEKAALTGRFLRRKLEEHEALLAEIEALQAELEADRDQNQHNTETAAK